MSKPLFMLAPDHPNCRRILRKGMRGKDVKWLQRMLRELNEMKALAVEGIELKENGYFCRATARCLSEFQTARNLVADSHFDRATCYRLETDYLTSRIRTGSRANA